MSDVEFEFAARKRLATYWVVASLAAALYFVFNIIGEIEGLRDAQEQQEAKLLEINESIDRNRREIVVGLEELASMLESEAELVSETKRVTRILNHDDSFIEIIDDASRKLALLEWKRSSLELALIQGRCILLAAETECNILLELHDVIGVDRDELEEYIEASSRVEGVDREFLSIVLAAQFTLVVRQMVLDPTIILRRGGIEQNTETMSNSYLSILIPGAYAQSDMRSSDVKLGLNFVWFIYLALGIAWFMCIWRVLFSDTDRNIEIAADMLKTLTGFFIGVGTSIAA